MPPCVGAGTPASAFDTLGSREPASVGAESGSPVPHVAATDRPAAPCRATLILSTTGPSLVGCRVPVRLPSTQVVCGSHHLTLLTPDASCIVRYGRNCSRIFASTQ